MAKAKRRNLVLLIALILLLGTVIEEAAPGRLMRLATGVFGIQGELLQLGAPPAENRPAGAVSTNRTIVGVTDRSRADVNQESEVSLAADIADPSQTEVGTAGDRESESGAGSAFASGGAGGQGRRAATVNPFVTSLLSELGGGNGTGTRGPGAQPATNLVFGSSTGAGVPAPDSVPTSIPPTDVGVGGNPAGGTSLPGTPVPNLVADEVLQSALSHRVVPSDVRAADPNALSPTVLVDVAGDGSRDDVREFVTTHYGSVEPGAGSQEGILRAELARADAGSGLDDDMILNPEPRTVILLGTGLFGLVLWHAAKRRRSQ